MSGRRTLRESRALKEKIVRLKRQGKSNAEIGRELVLSRQYVSYALISTGWPKQSRTRNRPPSKQATSDEEAQATITRLEQHSEYGLAEMLRAIAKRRAKNNKDSQ
jgi:hypothetical protein